MTLVRLLRFASAPILILCLLAVSPGTLRSTAPEPVSRTAVVDWPGGAKAAISITMDDGYANQWRFMAPLLQSRGYRGTFFVVTQWLDQEDLWAPWEKIAEAGHEIGSHGLTHVALPDLGEDDLVVELEWSRRRIEQRLGAGQGRTIAYPFSQATASIAVRASRAGYEAARTGGDRTNPPAPPSLYLVQSRHPLSDTSLWQMNAWVDEVRESGGWLVVGVHGIRDPRQPFPPTQEGWEPVLLERYAAFIDHIAAAGDLWVAPFGEAARYVRAREAVVVAREELDGPQLTVELEGAGDGTAVSLVTEVPAEWERVRVRGAVGEVAVRQADKDGSRRVVRYRAAPPATVILSPAS